MLRLASGQKVSRLCDRRIPFVLGTGSLEAIPGSSGDVIRGRKEIQGREARRRLNTHNSHWYPTQPSSSSSEPRAAAGGRWHTGSTRPHVSGRQDFIIEWQKTPQILA